MSTDRDADARKDVLNKRKMWKIENLRYQALFKRNPALRPVYFSLDQDFCKAKILGSSEIGGIIYGTRR